MMAKCVQAGVCVCLGGERGGGGGGGGLQKTDVEVLFKRQIAQQ